MAGRLTAPLLLVVALQIAAAERAHFTIDAVIDPAAKRIVATSAVTVSGGGSVDLDLRAFVGTNETAIMQVDEVRVGGRVVPTTTVDDGKTLRVAVPAGETTIAVRYTVALRDSGRQSIGYYLFESAREAEHWYPLFKDTRFADFDVRLDHPAGWTILTSGTGTSETANGVTRERLRAEHVEGFALAIGEGYRLQTLERDGIRAVAFSTPEQMETFHGVARHALDAAAWYKRAYGFFPVAQIGIVPGYKRAAGGYPLPNAFMIHQAILDDDFVAAITAHELAHYYWGLYVLDADERLGWLTLAHGIWADQKYLAQRKNISLLEQWRDTSITPAGSLNFLVAYTTALAGGYDQRLGISRDEEKALGYDYNSYVRHGKGATGLMLQALRIGDEKFLELQRGLLRDFAYKELSTREFAARLEAAGAAGAAEFFDRWQRGDGRIDYAVTDVVCGADGTLDVTVTKRGTVAYPMTVEVEDERGARVRQTTTGGVLQFDVAAARRVVLDPDGAIPMWNSEHPGMRRVFLKGLAAAGMTGPFNDLARIYLATDPNASDIRYLLADSLFSAGDFTGALALAQTDALTTPNDCRVVVLRARALMRSGSVDDARRTITKVEKSAPCAVIVSTIARARREIGN